MRLPLPEWRLDHCARIDLAAIDAHCAAEAAADSEGRHEDRVSREARGNRCEIGDLAGRAAAGHSGVLLVGSSAAGAGFMRIERCVSILASARAAACAIAGETAGRAAQGATAPMTGVQPRDSRERSGYVQGHLSMFQMSWSSFHWPCSLGQTAAYLSASSCGLAPLVVKVAVPIPRAASGPSGFTSRVVSLMSPGWCCIWPAQNFWMSARPFTIGAPAGST